MNPIDAQARLEVTLTAEQWNQIIALLGEVSAPYRVTAPLIQALGAQMAQAAQMASAPAPAPNGPDIVRHVYEQ